MSKVLILRLDCTQCFERFNKIVDRYTTPCLQIIMDRSIVPTAMIDEAVLNIPVTYSTNKPVEYLTEIGMPTAIAKHAYQSTVDVLLKHIKERLAEYAIYYEIAHASIDFNYSVLLEVVVHGDHERLFKPGNKVPSDGCRPTSGDGVLLGF